MREKSVKTLLITTKENHVELMKVIAGHVCVRVVRRLIWMKNGFAFP
jgi:hypothetical protein